MAVKIPAARCFPVYSATLSIILLFWSAAALPLFSPSPVSPYTPLLAILLGTIIFSLTQALFYQNT